jgi:cation:H+ antiporter
VWFLDLPSQALRIFSRNIPEKTFLRTFKQCYLHSSNSLLLSCTYFGCCFCSRSAFFALAFGGDVLTSGAAAVSVNFKIDPIVVGLTVVSIATSMPEMATSFMAVKDSPGIALGNILGSNIANIALILGIAAVIAPLKIKRRLIRPEVPILIGITIIFSLFAMGGGFRRLEGLILLTLTVVYLIYVVRGAKVKGL